MAYLLRRSPRHQGEPKTLKRFWRRDEPRSTESQFPWDSRCDASAPPSRTSRLFVHSEVPHSSHCCAALCCKAPASRDNCRRSMSEHIVDSSAAAAASGYFISQTLSSVPDRPLCQRQHRMGRRVGAKQQSEGSNDCHSRVTSSPPTSCGN